MDTPGSATIKQMVLAGAAAFAVCAAVGWWNAGGNLSKGRKQQRPQQAGGGIPIGQFGGPSPHQAQAPGWERKLEELLHKADTLHKQGKYLEAERAYDEIIELLNVIQTIDSDVGFLIRRMYMQQMECAERRGDHKKLMDYAKKALTALESKDMSELTEQEGEEMHDIIEKMVEISFTTGTPVKDFEHVLKLWLDAGDKIGKKQSICVASNLLGKIKIDQEKYAEAEVFFKRCMSEYKTESSKDELWLTTGLLLISAYVQQSKDTEAKNQIKALAQYVQNSRQPPNRVAQILSNLGDHCFDLGYYEEAEYILLPALSLMKLNSFPVEDQGVVDAMIGETLAEAGKLDQARARFKELRKYINNNPPPLVYSRYLRTIDSTFESGPNNTATAKLVLEMRHDKKKQKLPSPVVLVCDFENPQEGAPAIRESLTLPTTAEEQKATITIPLPFSKVHTYIAEVALYSDANQSVRLGTHFVLCRSTVDSTTGARSTASTAVNEEALSFSKNREADQIIHNIISNDNVDATFLSEAGQIDRALAGISGVAAHDIDELAARAAAEVLASTDKEALMEASGIIADISRDLEREASVTVEQVLRQQKEEYEAKLLEAGLEQLDENEDEDEEYEEELLHSGEPPSN